MTSGAKIKWRRLRHISQEITNRKINIHASTALADDIRAATTWRKDYADIVLNLNYLKALDEVIEAIAHELAHITLNSQEHSNAFMNTWDDIKNKIKNKYEEVNKDGEKN